MFGTCNLYFLQFAIKNGRKFGKITKSLLGKAHKYMYMYYTKDLMIYIILYIFQLEISKCFFFPHRMMPGPTEFAGCVCSWWKTTFILDSLWNMEFRCC